MGAVKRSEIAEKFISPVGEDSLYVADYLQYVNVVSEVRGFAQKFFMWLSWSFCSPFGRRSKGRRRLLVIFLPEG